MDYTMRCGVIETIYWVLEEKKAKKYSLLVEVVDPLQGGPALLELLLNPSHNNKKPKCNNKNPNHNNRNLKLK